MQITAQNTARMKAHGRTGGGRSQGGVRVTTRRVEDPSGAEETQRLDDTLSPGAQGGPVVTSGRGGARVPEN